MGIYLKLLPFFDGVRNCSHEILDVEQDYDLFDRIRDMPSMEVDDDFTSFYSRDGQFEGHHYGNTEEDAHGERLRWVLAKDLKLVDIPGPTGAYVAAMNDRDRIALYWD